MNAAVAKVLNQFLGDWLEGLNSEQLNLSVFSGEVRLGPIRIKKEAVEKLGLPFLVRYGFVKRIYVKIPWAHLTSKPLIIEVEDVYVLLGLRPMAEWNSETELTNYALSKATRLQQLEVLNSEAFSPPQVAGFVEKLVAKIVANVQIKLSNLYVRLEDEEASSGRFALGLVLTKLEAVTCDAEYRPAFVEDSDAIYKLGNMQDFALFLDYGEDHLLACHSDGSELSHCFESLSQQEVKHEFQGQHLYLLSPSTVNLRVKMNKDTKRKTLPEVEASLVIGEHSPIQFAMEALQLTHILKFAEFYSAYSSFQAGILSKVDTVQWTEEESFSYRELYKDWYSSKEDKRKSDPLLGNLTALEANHSYDEIAFHRTKAFKELQEEAQLRSAMKERSKSADIFSGVKEFFMGKSEPNSALSEPELVRVQSEMRTDECKSASEKSDAALYQLRVTLPSLIFMVRSTESPLITFMQEGVETDITLREVTMSVAGRIGQILINDEVVNSEVFPYIFKSASLKFAYSTRLSGTTDITVKAEHAFIVANLQCALALSSFVESAVSSQFNIDHYRRIAGDKVAGYVSAGQKYMEQIMTGEYTHQAVNLDIDFPAPCALVPLDIMKAENCLVVDLGRLIVKSQLVDNFKSTTDLSAIEDEAMIYDFYKITVSGMRVAVLWNFPEIERWTEGTMSHLFSPSPLFIEVGNAVSKDIGKFPALLARINFDELSFHLSDEQLLFLLRLKDQLSEKVEEVSPKKPNREKKKPELQPLVTPHNEIDNFREKMKQVEKVLTQHFQFKMGRLSLSLKKKGEKLAEFFIQDVKVLSTITETGNILADFQLGELRITDCRPAVFFTAVLGKPHTDSTTSFLLDADDQYRFHSWQITEKRALSEEAQLSARFKLTPKEDLTEGFVALSDMRLAASCDFVKALSEFHVEAVDTAEKEVAARKLKKKLQVKSLMTQAFILEIQTMKHMPREVETIPERKKTLLTVFIQNLEVWVLESSMDAESRVVDVYLEATLRYNSFQHLAYHMDTEGSIVRTDFLHIDDEATVDISKFGITSGYYKENAIVKSAAGKEELLTPCRLEIEYSVTKKGGPTVTHIESHIEAVEVTVGFRDILHFKQLATQWQSLSAPQTPASKPASSAVVVCDKPQPASTDEMHIDFKCDNLEVTLVDDTGIRVVALVFFDLHNVSAALVMSDIALLGSFSTAMKMNYYNAMNAIWEPIVEEWSMEVALNQPTTKSPVGVELTSVCFLNINLSYMMAETVALALMKLNQDTSQWEQENPGTVTVTETELEFSSGSQIIYKLKNRLGVDLKVWLEGIDATHREVWTVVAGKTYRFGQALIDRARMKGMASGKRKYACLTQSAQQASAISIEIERKGVVHNIILDDITTKSFRVDTTETSMQETIVVDITSRGGERIVSIESVVKVVNNTDMDFEILHSGNVKQLKAMRVFALPLDWLHGEKQTSLMTELGPVDLLKTLGVIPSSKTTFLSIDLLTLDSGVSDVHSVQIPHQRLVILNAPVTLQNLTPAFLNLHFREDSSPALSLYPGNFRMSYQFDPRNVREHKWRLEMEGGVAIETDWVNPKKNIEHYKMSGNFPCDKLFVEFIPMTYVKSKDLDLKFKKFVEEKWHSSIVQVYLQFMIVNRTPFTLQFTGKRDYLKIPKYSIGTVKDKKSQMSVRTAEDDFGRPSEWSKSFNIKTVGVAGSLSLNNSEASAANPDAPNVIQLGVMLSNADWPLTKTVIVKVQPRFIVSNYLSSAVFLRQCERSKTISIAPGESVPYQLENAKVGHAVQVSADGEQWSSGFTLEVIEDFQVRFRDKPEERKPVVCNEPKVGVLAGFVVKKPKEEALKPLEKLEWWKPSAENDCQRYVRVIISTEDEATLFISFTNPIDPEFMISNQTEEELFLKQEGCEYEGKVAPRQKCTFAYDNQLAKVKRMILRLGPETAKYAIDKIKVFKNRLNGSRVRVVTEGVTRVVIVEHADQQEPLAEEPKSPEDLCKDESVSDLSWINAENRFENLKIKAAFAGLCLSLIDDMPCERFIFSISEIKATVVQTAEPTEKGRTVAQRLKLAVGNVQLDNMQARESQFPVMLAPYMTKQDSKAEPVPFLQLRIEKDATLYSGENSGQVKGTAIEHFKHVGLLMQPVHLQVHQETIMGLLGVTARLQEAFAAVNSTRGNQSIISLEFVKICPGLEASAPKLSYNASQVSAKAYFEFVNLNSMKIIVSFRSAKKSVGLQVDPREAFGIVSIFAKVGSAFINITDSPLHFSNLILVHSFQTMDAMTWTIAENYIRQGLLQFYKIIGSSDMIGNPIGLIDKLGTGVFEFFNEPRKGLLKGPKEFAEGIGKGVKSLVSGVISGGFGSVSRITGSLYNVVRGVGGDDDSYDRINRNDNVLEGVFHGFKGGLVDLAEGVTGLFTKPFKGAKTGGVTGFLKGMGSGLLGVVTSPLSAVLRVGTSVTTGIANTATILRTGKIQHKGRFRFPRPIGARKVIEPYNEDIAQVQELLKNLEDFQGEKLVFYQRIDEELIVLVTTTFLLEIVGGDVSSSLRLAGVEVLQVHKLDTGLFLLATSGSEQVIVKSAQFTGLAKLFSVLCMCCPRINAKLSGPGLVKYRAPTRRCCK